MQAYIFLNQQMHINFFQTNDFYVFRIYFYFLIIVKNKACE